MAEERLQKYLAEAGVASRRKCEELISLGRVEVNGRVIMEQGMKVNGSEIIKVDGREIRPEQRKVYILLNKPAGYISTARDQFSRKTVLDLVDTLKERIYPVGRLDYDTSGLLLLTNDGELANKLTHPKHEIPKVYRAMILGNLKEDDIESLQTGVYIEEYKTAPAKIKVIESGKKESVIEITIHEGKNRQVRKMFEALGYTVLRLKRIAIGPLDIEGIEEGKWRYLRQKEIDSLKKAAGIGNQPGPGKQPEQRSKPESRSQSELRSKPESRSQSELRSKQGSRSRSELRSKQDSSSQSERSRT